VRALALLVAAASLLAGCGGARGAGSPVARPVSPAQGLPPGWGRIRPLLEQGEALAFANDAEGLARLAPSLEHEGLSLLKANVPNTLPRHEMPRYLEGRAAFGDALVRVAEAREQGRAADLPALVRSLAGAWRGWMAVITGTSPEKAV
jgi:hypothetical protein